MSQNDRAEDIEAAAAAWFEKREWSHWDSAAEAELQAWLAQSTAHHIAFIRLEAAWERAERLKALGAGVPPGQVPERGAFGLQVNAATAPHAQTTPITGETARYGAWASRLKWAVGAASFAAALSAFVWYQALPSWQSYGTQIGMIAPVALADGSRITLDSNTRIQVALGKDRRRIRLDRGEALFDVAKDPSRPLIVEVANKRVTAVGTEFSVRRDSDDITVLVKGGRVRIESGDEHFAGRATELEAGGEASSRGAEVVVERVSLEEVDRALSWRDGYLVFDATPLSQAVAEFNRYRVQKIEIRDPSIETIRVGGRFRCTDAEAFLTLLQQGFPVAVTRDENRIALSKR
jgi:transmembrane sensor